MESTAADLRLKEAWRVLRERIWLIVTVAGLTVGLVSTDLLLTDPTYKASAVLQIERINPNIVNFSDVMAQDYSYAAYSDYYQTQFKLISSREILARVARRLEGLQETGTGPGQARRRGLLRGLGNLLAGLLPGDDPAPPTPAGAATPSIGLLTAGLEVVPVPNTHLVEVSFISHSPERAAMTANLVAEEYMDFNRRMRNRTTGMAGEKLEAEALKLSREIEDLNGKLREFSSAHTVIKATEEKELAIATLEELSAAATAARIERSRREAAYRALQSSAGSPAPDHDEDDGVLQDLRRQLHESRREYAEKGEIFKPGYPEMAALRAQIESAEAQIREVTERRHSQRLEQAHTALLTAADEEERLVRLEAEQRKRVQEIEQHLTQYDRLNSDIQARKDMLASLIRRRDETGVLQRVEEAGTGNIWIVEQARRPAGPYRPRYAASLVAALAIGLILGFGLALGVEHLDDSVKKREDVTRTLGEAVLGLIPALPTESRGRLARQGPTVELPTNRLPTGRHAEAFRDLRTTLLLSTPDHPPRLLMVTSPAPEEGKTTTVANLAVSLAQAGQRVLLVDADMRRPRLHKVLGTERRPGLSQYLAGSHVWRGLVRPTGVEGLQVLPAGATPPNPGELLASRNLMRMLTELADDPDIDHVLLDAPPVLPLADPGILAPRVDGVLLIARAGGTSRRALLAAADKIRSVNGRIVGVVLTHVTAAHREYDDYAYDSTAEPRQAADQSPGPAVTPERPADTR